jgi:hypothetical protein
MILLLNIKIIKILTNVKKNRGLYLSFVYHFYGLIRILSCAFQLVAFQIVAFRYKRQLTFQVGCLGIVQK